MLAQPCGEDEGTDELLQGGMGLKLLPGASVRLARLLWDLSFQMQSGVPVHSCVLALLNQGKVVRFMGTEEGGGNHPKAFLSSSVGIDHRSVGKRYKNKSVVLLFFRDYCESVCFFGKLVLG